MIEAPHKYSGTYNVGFENLSILEIAELVSRETNAKINIRDSDDPRSYRVNSDRILETGFAPKKSVLDAIIEIKNGYHSGEITNKPQWHTTSWMKIIRLENCRDEAYCFRI